MASRALAVGAFITMGVASLCAYTNHLDFVTNGEDLQNARFDYEQMRKIAHSVAAEMMDEQRKCLAKDPSDWCNRDLQFKDHYRSAYRQMAMQDKFQFAEGSTNRQHRNQWLLVLAAAILVFAYQIRGLVRQARLDGPGTDR